MEVETGGIYEQRGGWLAEEITITGGCAIKAKGLHFLYVER